QGSNSPNYGGYFAWNTTIAGLNNAGYTLDQCEAIGGGYVGKAASYGGTTITLVGGSTSVSGNQRTVTFKVRPNSTFPVSAANDISLYSMDACGNANGWLNFDLNFSSQTTQAITCPSNIVVTGCAPQTVTYSTPTSTCNTPVALNAGLASGATFPVGTTTVTYNTYYPNGAGGLFNYPPGATNQQIALAACESVYGAGNCSIGSCGSFTYYYQSGALSCDCAKPVGSYEFIYSNTGYTYVGEDYGGNRLDNVSGNQLFTRVKTYNTCSSGPSWTLAEPALGQGGATCSFTVTNTDNVSPTYTGTTVTGANYVNGNTYYVKSGTTFYTNVSHADNCASNYQYLEYTYGNVGWFGSWDGASGNIKSYATPYGVSSGGTFGGYAEGLADDQFINIQTVTCQSAGNCNTSVLGRWQNTVGSGPSRWYHVTVYMYDQTWNGVGYTDTGLDIYIDNTLSSTPGAPTCTSGSGTVNQTWSISACTDAESGINSSGYEWQWSYDNSSWNTWFTGGTSGSGTWDCDRTVYIRARSKDNVGNASAWSASANAPTAVSSTAPVSISGTSTICNGGSTTLTASGGTHGTGASYQWFTGSCGGTSAGSGVSITVSPTSNTTYYVRRTGSCNTTSCASLLVTVNTPPTAPTAISGTPATIC
ncbi:MAG TPA: hypothetical protein PLA77_09320, partial [Bacteroidales bacterium]|nr:hypothetical protein [Bacteroidales bacterium]